MRRITTELIENSVQCINTLRHRELEMRHNQIGVIENMGSTQDQFDTIDLSHNEIAKLGGFPRLTRLQTLFLANNQIQRISKHIGEQLPELRVLILSNNRIRDFHCLARLSVFSRTLTSLSMKNNPITNHPHYRIFVFRLLPRLRWLDFQKITAKEKKASRTMFPSSQSIDVLLEKIESSPTTTTTTTTTNQSSVAAASSSGLSSKEKQQIEEAIANASSLQEINTLEAALAAGQLPKDWKNTKNT
mmetsp:Transcript_18629/g.27753  ORF Transcript_18629/g.27753 Transcript_18629/m.27753 type:complete len:246 (-) Transcript_18629:120-857(-)